MSRARTLLPVLLVAIALIVAGCASSDNGTSGGGAQSGGNSGGSASVAFATPTAGAKVTSPVDVAFTVQGAQIGQPETGKMHFHVYVDQSSDYKILYTTSGKLDVPAGQHTLKVVLAQPNHTETATTATEQVDVTGSSGGAGAPTTTAGGYGYP